MYLRGSGICFRDVKKQEEDEDDIDWGQLKPGNQPKLMFGSFDISPSFSWVFSKETLDKDLNFCDETTLNVCKYMWYITY